MGQIISKKRFASLRFQAKKRMLSDSESDQNLDIILRKAVFGGHLDICELLIEKGANDEVMYCTRNLMEGGKGRFPTHDVVI